MPLDVPGCTRATMIIAVSISLTNKIKAKASFVWFFFGSREATFVFFLICFYYFRACLLDRFFNGLSKKQPTSKVK